MEIDNFDIIRSHLTFEDKFDRYVINILRRTKDVKNNELGSNESQRLFRTYYIGDLEYFDRKIPAIKELCKTNNARAYILPQVRNNRDCLLNLGKLVLENIDNPTIKLDGIVRKAVCSLHSSRAKRWILDVDDDNLVEYAYQTSAKDDKLVKKTWTLDEVFALVKDAVAACNGNVNDVYAVKTPHGHCIVTPPFDLKKAFAKCKMLFQSQAKFITGIKHIGPGEHEYVHKKINGWIMKDGMALLYSDVKS